MMGPKHRQAMAAVIALAACLWCVQGYAADRVLYPFVVGGGAIEMNPPGGSYANDTTITITAQPEPGWTFTHWVIERLNPNTSPDDPTPPGYEVRVRNSAIWAPVTSTVNPETVTLKGMNAKVTAHFKGPELTIDITGEGKYSVDPPPPGGHVGYEPGTQVTIIFSPAGGQLLTNTFPYVSPPQGDDCAPQWIFNHWSWNPGVAWQFGNPGVEPVVRTTMDADKTIYATFVKKGSTAHPTDEQEVQLMNIARANYGPWSGLTPAQAAALETKIENYYQDEKEHYLWWGQVSGAVWYNDFGRTSPAALDKIGDSMAFNGIYLAGLAMKHAVKPDCQETIADINVVLDAIDRLTMVTGTPGWVARFSGPANSPPYQWYYSQAGNLGVYPGAAPYQNEVWIGWPSRDTHFGLFVGLAASLHFVEDQPTWDKTRMLVERVVDRLLLDNYVIRDGFRTTATNARLQQLQRRVA